MDKHIITGLCDCRSYRGHDRGAGARRGREHGPGGLRQARDGHYILSPSVSL